MKTLSPFASTLLALSLAPAGAAAQSFTIGTNGQAVAETPIATTTTAGDGAYDTGVVQEFVVEEKADVRSERALLEKRKNAETVSDSIGAQEIARTPDAGAQDSVKRITSATVQDGKYVLVRGLGGRYGQTLLNGVQLPSPEPDKQAVPLDLFPNALLSNLTVMKTYSADLPGNFAGGSLKIETSAYPTEFESKVKLSTSGDTQSTGREQRTYGGGSLDFLGMDDGSRSLPGSVPKNGPLLSGQGGMDDASVDAVGRDFDNRWSARTGTALPNLSLGATVGNTRVMGTNKLGWLATFNYGHKYGVQETDVARVRNEGGAVAYREKAHGSVGTRGATVGALLNGGFQLGPDHEIGLLTLYTHAGESKTSVVSGYSESDAQNFEATRLEFVNRLLSFTQLSGKHNLREAGGLELDWQSNVSLTLRHEPDTRDTDYSVLDDGRMRFKAEPGSGERFFSDLTDLSTGAGATAYGVELEARASLYRLHPALLPFRVAGNVALIESRIDLGDQAGVQTNGKRPLQGLSPLVVNLNAGWIHPKGTEVTVLYNVFGKRLTEVGFDTLPDVYEYPFHRVDLAVTHPFRNGMQMKVAATNLLDQSVEHKAAGLTVLRTKPGVGGALSLEWSR